MIVSYTHSVIHAIQGQMLCTLKHFAFNRKKFLRNANRRTKRKDRYLLYVLINKTDLNLLNEFIHVGQHTDVLISDLFQSACLRHKSFTRVTDARIQSNNNLYLCHQNSILHIKWKQTYIDLVFTKLTQIINPI